jgi:hypothetical protein
MLTEYIAQAIPYQDVDKKNSRSNFLKKIKLKAHKILHWEYWPFHVIYFPMHAVWLYYAIRSKSFFFFNAANPRIKNGGFLMESKKEIYDLIPNHYYPTTILIQHGSSLSVVKEQLSAKALSYPLIAKPDIGMRGMAVQKINSEQELLHYNAASQVNYLIQKFIDLPNEAGVFFVRIPGEASGKITGIVAKEFLIVKGDGNSTLLELLEKNPRFHLQLDVLQKEYKHQLNFVVPEGEEMNLVPYGNHCRGAKFTDASIHATTELNNVINNVCTQIPEFYFGRLDIKYNTMEEFKAGKNFSIIELNGAGSEPTHIYDPAHSIFFAWKEIARHFNYLYLISKANKSAGAHYLSMREGITMLKENNLLLNKLQSFSIS